MDILERKPTLAEKFTWHKMHALSAVFSDTEQAHAMAEQLLKQDFPMNQLSIIHLPDGQTTDFLGLSYNNEQKRTIVWAENGALWGAMMGFAVGTAGLLFVPGVGMLLALGPVIDLIAGAAIGSGIMAGAAQATRLSHALHQIGIPKDKTTYFHDVLLDGKTILILHYGKDDYTDWQHEVDWSGAESVERFSAGINHNVKQEKNEYTVSD